MYCAFESFSRDLTEGRNKMQFFMPVDGTWGDFGYSDTEGYASQPERASMYEVSFTDLPDTIQAIEGDCE